MLTAHVALVSETQAISSAQLSAAAAAIQKQVTRDFGPIWNVQATVDAFDTLDAVPLDYWPVIMQDNINEPGAAGYHTDNQGQPFSLVQADDGWELTASHEALEMLADPFGNRTVAGTPPPQAPQEILALDRVTYLVEVCDPCETVTYPSNGHGVSDFITPAYYDPKVADGVRYSFSGQVSGPHNVLEGGYVSFGNPIDNHWYQIIVEGGKAQLRDLGVLQGAGSKSLRELIDSKVRQLRSKDGYRLKSRAATKSSGRPPFAEKSAARAARLRAYIKGLK
jgi:hypothetical protein